MSSPSLVVHALVTPSHEALAREWFLRTLPADCRPVLHRVDAPPVVYGDPDWPRVVANKFDALEQAFDAHAAGSVFVMSDVDIRFYRPFAADVTRRMAGLELLFQNNRPGEPESLAHLCSGFMVVRAGRRTRSFFRRARAVVARAERPGLGDQRACIEVLAADPGSARCALLPESYWTPYRHGPRWRPGTALEPPPGIVLHHANWTVGNEFKRAQLAAVERSVASGALAAGGRPEMGEGAHGDAEAG